MPWALWARLFIRNPATVRENNMWQADFGSLSLAEPSLTVINHGVFKTRVCCRVEQSADSMGAAQIEIQAKKFFHGLLEKSFKIQRCQKPNKNRIYNPILIIWNMDTAVKLTYFDPPRNFFSVDKIQNFLSRINFY